MSNVDLWTKTLLACLSVSGLFKCILQRQDGRVHAEIRQEQWWKDWAVRGKKLHCSKNQVCCQWTWQGQTTNSLENGRYLDPACCFQCFKMRAIQSHFIFLTCSLDSRNINSHVFHVSDGPDSANRRELPDLLQTVFGFQLWVHDGKGSYKFPH